MKIKIKNNDAGYPTFDPGPTDGVWCAVIVETKVFGETVMKPKHVAAFKVGFVRAFEHMRGGDLVGLLTNFATVLERQAVPTVDHGLTEANRFVNGVIDELNLVDWLQDSKVVIDDDGFVRPLAGGVPSLNEAAVRFLIRGGMLNDGAAQTWPEVGR